MNSATTHDIAIPDLFSPEAASNPYPIYNEIREQSPLVWYERSGMWLFTRYQDVSALVRDPRLSSGHRHNSDRLPPQIRDKIKQMDESLSDWTVFLDGEDHLRLRHWLNKAFTPAAIAGLAPKIDEAIAHLLREVEGHDTFDMLRLIAGPLPAMVIGMILGVPAEDIGLVKQWSEGLSNFFSGKAPMAGPAAHEAMTEYVGHIVRDRRQSPQDDLISAMIHAEPSGRPLTDRELLANCVMLLFAGHETKIGRMCNGMIALLQNPVQQDLMRRDPSVLVSGIEEFLRMEPAFLLVSRIVGNDLEMHGAVIPTGSRIGLLIAAANRDPRQFDRPDDFEAARHPNQHLSFGAGPHFCLGAPLARTETRLLYQALFRQFKSFVLAEELEWMGSAVFRVPKKVEVQVVRN